MPTEQLTFHSTESAHLPHLAHDANLQALQMGKVPKCSSLQGFAVWEGDAEEPDSIDDIVSRLTETSSHMDSSNAEGSSRTVGQGKADLRKPKFSWRDFGPSRTPKRTE